MLKHGGCVASDREHESGVKTILRMRANEPRHPGSIARLRFFLAIVPNRAIHTRVLVVNEATFIQHCCKPHSSVSKIDQPLELRFY